MTLTKGTYVKHPKDKTHANWGIGIVLEDERSGKVPVFFEHTSQRKFIGTDYVQLQTVCDPGDAEPKLWGQALQSKLWGQALQLTEPFVTLVKCKA